jgi:hypothetical protein
MRLKARAAEALRIEDGEVVSRLKARVRGSRTASIVAIRENMAARSVIAVECRDYLLDNDARRKLSLDRKKRKVLQVDDGQRCVAFV